MTAANSGLILFGYSLDIVLYGILTVQTYLYYLAFPQDRRTTKSIVYFVYIIETLQTVLALHDFYVLFQKNHNPEFLGFGISAFSFVWFTIPVDGTLVAFAVQLFYAHRIYVISRARVITAIVSILAFLQFICGTLSVVCTFKFRHALRFDRKSVSNTGDIILSIGPASGAACDLLIATYMSCYLSRQIKGTSKATQTLATKIGRLLLETGILTAAVAVAYVILAIFTPGGIMIPGLSLGKLYANSMLVLLNNRFTIPGGRNVLHTDFDISSYRHSDSAGASTGIVVSHSITFAYNHQEEATHSSGEVHTTGLNPPNRRVSPESRG